MAKEPKRKGGEDEGGRGEEAEKRSVILPSRTSFPSLLPENIASAFWRNTSWDVLSIIGNN